MTLARLVPPWHIRITNFGLGYILAILLVAIAATNTGNNGLYVVLSGLLGALAVSGVVSRRNLRSVTCEMSASGEIFAGRPCALRFTLSNRSRRLTAQGLWLLHEGLPAPVYVEPLAPGERRVVEEEAVFPRRGVVASSDAGLMSAFPIGLFRKYRDARYTREVVVYPSPRRSERIFPPEEPYSAGPRRSRRAGFGAEIRTLREFAPGDDVRDLHWKQSARMQKWIVREREEERARAVVFAVDNACADPLDPAQAGRVEAEIARAAGEALALLARGGEAGIVARGASLPPAAGLGQRRAILETLARLPVLPAAGAPPVAPVPRDAVRREVAA